MDFGGGRPGEAIDTVGGPFYSARSGESTRELGGFGVKNMDFTSLARERMKKQRMWQLAAGPHR